MPVPADTGRLARRCFLGSIHVDCHVDSPSQTRLFTKRHNSAFNAVIVSFNIIDRTPDSVRIAMKQAHIRSAPAVRVSHHSQGPRLTCAAPALRIPEPIKQPRASLRFSPPVKASANSAAATKPSEAALPADAGAASTRAIIIGGSVAGIFSAAAAAPYFEEVRGTTTPLFREYSSDAIIKGQCLLRIVESKILESLK